jgi:signal transduction histidine kinase
MSIKKLPTANNINFFDTIQIDIEQKQHFLRFFASTMFWGSLGVLPLTLYLAHFGLVFLIYPSTTIGGLVIDRVAYQCSFQADSKKITLGILLLIAYLHLVFLFETYLHGPSQPIACLFLITIIASRLLLPWFYTLLLMLTSAVVIIVTYLDDPNPILALTDPTISPIVTLTIWIFSFGISTALLTYLVSQIQASVRELEKRNQELLELNQTMEVVAENERGSIAHELHDVVVNPFETQLTWLESKLAEGLEASELYTSYQELVEVRQAMRRGLLNLHAAELKEHDLYTAMLYMIKRMCKDQPFRLQQHISDDLLEQDLNKNVQHAIYRITQQSLQNVIKHAEAKQVSVYLDFTGTTNLLLRISDDGKGFEVPADFTKLQMANHNGLAGFAQKVKVFGGILKIESQPGCGTTIEVEIPVRFVHKI